MLKSSINNLFKINHNIKDLEQKINILDTRIDQLENNMQEMCQAIVASIDRDPFIPF